MNNYLKRKAKENKFSIGFLIGFSIGMLTNTLIVIFALAYFYAIK